MSRILLWLIVTYQRWVSPLFGPTCRFEPSCSRYAYEAIQRHGVCCGVGVALLRLVKCHPFHPGGVDPVP